MSGVAASIQNCAVSSSTNRLQGSIMERVSGMAAPSAGSLSLVLTFNLIFVVAVSFRQSSDGSRPCRSNPTGYLRVGFSIREWRERCAR